MRGLSYPRLSRRHWPAERIELGAIDTVRDFLYVSDTVRGFMSAADCEHADGEVVQLGTGCGTVIASVVETVGRILGRKLEIHVDGERQRPQKSEVRRLICSPAKAASLLNWTPQVDLEAGLLRTIEWIDAHRAEFRTGCYSI